MYIFWRHSKVLLIHFTEVKSTVKLFQSFYCSSRQEFDDLCQQLHRVTVGDTRPVPLIEVHSERPAHFPPAQPYVPTLAASSAMAGKCLQAPVSLFEAFVWFVAICITCRIFIIEYQYIITVIVLL